MVRIGAIASVLLVGCGLTGGDNQPPVIERLDKLIVDEGKPMRVTVVATDADDDDLELTFFASRTLETERIHQVRGRVEADVSLIVDVDFNGITGFSVSAFDGHVQTNEFYLIEVRPVNDRPIAAAESFAASVDTSLTIFHSTLLMNDLDGDEPYGDRQLLSITNVDGAVNGTVTLGQDTITFVPAASFAGTATFDYTLSDGEVDAVGNAAVDVATVSIAVGAANTAPVAKDDVVVTSWGGPLYIEPRLLTGNDVDLDGQALAVVAVSNATHGTVQTSGGVVAFTLEDLYYGPDAGFDYTVTDGVGTDTGHVQMLINTGE
jgi:hypothetical protein